MSRGRLLVLVLVVVAVASFFASGAHRYFTFEHIKARAGARSPRASTRIRLATAAAFFALYVAVTALSLPGAALLTLAAGAHLRLPAGAR